MHVKKPWDELDIYRGKHIKGEWPTIPEQFHLSARLYPEQTAFTQLSPVETRISYRELEEHVSKTASWLVEKGLKKGGRVALTGKNSPWWGIAYLSVLEAGGVIVPLDTQMEEKTVRHLLEFVEAGFLFADAGTLEDSSDGRLGIKHRISLTPQTDNFITELKPRAGAAFDSPKEDDLAAILFTSGTTGREKGVMLTHKNFMSDVYQACHPDYLQSVQEDVWYALLPLHHSYCMTAVFLEGIKHGSEIVFAQGIVVDKIMQDLEFGKVTIFMGVPLLYNKILKGLMRKVREKGLVSYALVRVLLGVSGGIRACFKANPGKKIFGNLLLKKANLYNLKYLISGGGPLAPEIVRGYQALGLNFIQGYGMTETAPISTLNPAHAFKVESVGKVFPLIEMTILNPDKSGVGEVAVKGPICTQGYWKNKEATEALFNEEGWLLTGDLGSLDSEGYLYLRGRSKNLIVTSGGKNIFPEEIEDYFQLHNQIDHMMVRGYVVDEEARSEGIEALVHPSRDYYETLSLDKDAVGEDILGVIRDVNRELAAYKKITRVRIVEHPLPMTSTKKIKRMEVNELHPPIEEGALKV